MSKTPKPRFSFKILQGDLCVARGEGNDQGAIAQEALRYYHAYLDDTTWAGDPAPSPRLVLNFIPEGWKYLKGSGFLAKPRST